MSDWDQNNLDDLFGGGIDGLDDDEEYGFEESISPQIKKSSSTH